MPKITIMAEVSVDVMDNVVKPKKAEKVFAKFVSTLLTSYYENETIRSIVDGAVDQVDLEGVRALQEQLARANQSLGFMGMMTDSTLMGLSASQEDIGSVTGNSSEEVPTTGTSVSTGTSTALPSNVVTHDDLNAFKSDILSSMKELLLSGLQVGSSTQDTVPVSNTEVNDENLVKGTTLTSKVEVNRDEVQQEENIVYPQPVDNSEEFVENSNEVQGITPVEEVEPIEVEEEVTPTPMSSPVVSSAPPSDGFSFSVEEEEEPSEDLSGDDVLNSLLGGNNAISFGF